MSSKKISGGMIVTGVISAGFLVCALIIAGQALALAAKRAEVVPENTVVNDYKAAQAAKLSGYSYVNKAKGVVGLPIDRAMALVLKEGLPIADAPEPLSGDASAADLGKAVFTSLACAACHNLEGVRTVGPTFKGTFGTERALEGGRTAIFDEAYLKKSLFEPLADVAATFPPIMPAFTGRVSDEDITNLGAFLQSIK